MPSPSTLNKPLHFIENQNDLSQCLNELEKENTLAFDLEFDSHSYAYGVTLCLIQIATPAACYVIDPLADIDLNELYDIFEDERIQKIVHSPGEDLRLLHSLECYPRNVFDTEVVARLLNYEKTSLASLLDEKLGVAMDKKQQRSNWLRRPLSSEQLEYASADVATLHELKTILVAEATKKGLMDFVEEEQAALTTTIHETEIKTSFLKQADFYALSPYDQYVLNEIFLFRDELAREKNKPAYQVMDEPAVRALADGSLLPRDVLYAKGIYGSFKNERFIRQLDDKLDAIHEAAEKRELSRLKPERPRQTSDYRLGREMAERDKVEKFEPVQQELGKRFGEHAARYILSNGMVNDILKKNLTIGDIKRNYKRELILKAAVDLGVDLGEYL